MFARPNKYIGFLQFPNALTVFIAIMSCIEKHVETWWFYALMAAAGFFIVSSICVVLVTVINRCHEEEEITVRRSLEMGFGGLILCGIMPQIAVIVFRENLFVSS
uniref:RING-type domain-containing protein n=1 Tax=Caenorhabditis tropicalis TaxID=1561998 RepID=A0A1I7UYL8_9PELO